MSGAEIAPLWMYVVAVIHRSGLSKSATDRQRLVYKQCTENIAEEGGSNQFKTEKLKTVVVYDRKRVGRFVFSSSFSYRHEDSRIVAKRARTNDD